MFFDEVFADRLDNRHCVINLQSTIALQGSNCRQIFLKGDRLSLVNQTDQATAILSRSYLKDEVI